MLLRHALRRSPGHSLTGMSRLIGRLVKLSLLTGLVVSVIASVKATIAANAQSPADGT